MTIDDILALTKAGFTKTEIIQLTAPQQSPLASTVSPEEPAAAPAAPVVSPEKAEAPEKQAEDVGAIIDKKLSEAFKPFEDLYNNIALKANMPTIGQIEPKGIDDIIDNFFNK